MLKGLVIPNLFLSLYSNQSIMKEIKSTNAKHIFALFTKWRYAKLPYCTGGVPSYSSEEYDKYGETVEVEFLFFGRPAKAIFKRMVGRPTNYIWGMRHEGIEFSILIDGLLFSNCKEKEIIDYQYRQKVVTHSYTNNLSALTRSLKAIQNGYTTKFSTDDQNPNHLVYLPKSEQWHSVIGIEDYDKDAGFIFTTKYRYPEQYRWYFYAVPEILMEL